MKAMGIKNRCRIFEIPKEVECGLKNKSNTRNDKSISANKNTEKKSNVSEKNTNKKNTTRKNKTNKDAAKKNTSDKNTKKDNTSVSDKNSLMKKMIKIISNVM